MDGREVALTAVKATMVLDGTADLQAAGAGAHAIKRAYRVLDNVFSLAVRLGMVNANPVPHGKEERPHVPQSNEPRFLEVDEVERLTDAIDPAFRTWTLTLAYTGMRFGEAAGLRVRDIDPLHRTLCVRQQLTEVVGRLSFALPKTAAGQRTIDLPRFLVPLLEAQMDGKGPDDLVFVGANRAPLRRSNFLSRVWWSAVERAQITRCTPHALRHSYASWLLAKGTPVNEVSAALGHTQPSTTLNIYAHVMPHRRRAAADALDDMRNDAGPVVVAIRRSRRQADARLTAMPYTTAQRSNGARGVAYRSWQLAGVGVVYAQSGIQGDDDLRTVVQNALIESAIANGRALAEFFMDKREYVHVSAYSQSWSDPVQAVTGRIFGEASKHLGHVTSGSASGDPHPGAWPIVELGLTLVSALARFVGALGAADRALFTPDPDASLAWLVGATRGLTAGPVSANPGVAGLTTSLQAHVSQLRAARLLP